MNTSLHERCTVSNKMVRAPSCGHHFHSPFHYRPKTPMCLHQNTNLETSLTLKELQSDGCGCNKLDNVCLESKCGTIYISNFSHIHPNTHSHPSIHPWKNTDINTHHIVVTDNHELDILHLLKHLPWHLKKKKI